MSISNDNQSKMNTGCLWIILAIAIIAFFVFGGESESTQSSNSQTTQVEQSVDTTPFKNAIQQAKDTGLLTRIDASSDSYYIDWKYWIALDARQKENLVKSFALYHGYVLNDYENIAGVYVKDNQSGKTLATYGRLTGIEIK